MNRKKSSIRESQDHIRNIAACSVAKYLLILLLLLPTPAVWGSETIQAVTVEKRSLDFLVDKKITISWELGVQVEQDLYICDLNGNLVRSLMQRARLNPGSHTIDWDGLDEHGDRCPDGVYYPVIKARVDGRGNTVYNPTALNWGEDVRPPDIDFDGEAVRFTVAEPTYGRLRVGLMEGGPVYRTLAYWQLWMPGSHEVAWNGMDQEGVTTITGKKKLGYSFDAFTLPENAIVISGGGGVEQRRGYYKSFPAIPPTGAAASYFALTPSSLTAEPEIDARCAAEEKNTWRCVVGFADTTSDAATIPRGSELLIYHDDEFLVEFPIETIPVKVNFELPESDGKAHYLTLNLLTHDDRAGIAIKRIAPDK